MCLSSVLAYVAGAAFVLPLSACMSLPRSPVPAALTDTEAEVLARNYMTARGVTDIHVDSIRPDKTGYLVAYKSTFASSAQPPKVWRLVDVDNDGAVRELEWNSTQR